MIAVEGGEHPDDRALGSKPPFAEGKGIRAAADARLSHLTSRGLSAQ
jgi:hypothetical protein